MSRYDFKSLSHQDFEELTRDILQAEWGVSLEAFKTGRDGGIDLRYSRADKKTIIQCKHYAGSKFSNLLHELTKSELQKVVKINPQRYVLVTSLPLSPDDKEKIKSAMSPFINEVSDILGPNDIDGLLSKHPKIEETNFKLWFTNATVLSRILVHAEKSQTKFDIERIKRKIPLFVQNSAYSAALTRLEDQRILIISGVPGIGKTTLAEMLLFAHMESGYDPVIIQSEVLEGKKQFNAEEKQIFYYDDFLGQTFLGDQRSYFGKNHDLALLSFFEMVKSTSSSRIILTTREHILQQATQYSERLTHSNIPLHKCLLELESYTLEHRARILYNHLYFSDLPLSHKKVLLEDNFFIEIIKHKNFNPRLVEWLSSFTRMHSPDAANYKASVSKLIQAPQQLWSHAFETQISDSARDLILTLFSLAGFSDLSKLEIAFSKIHEGFCNVFNRPRGMMDFRLALAECDGAFFRFFSGAVTFINPSVRDYMSTFLESSPSVAIEMLNFVEKFEQVENIWDVYIQSSSKNIGAVIEKLIKDHSIIERLAFQPSYIQNTENETSSVIRVDTNAIQKLDTLISITETSCSKDYMDMVERYAIKLIDDWEDQQIECASVAALLSDFKNNSWICSQPSGVNVFKLLKAGLLDNLYMVKWEDWRNILELSTNAYEWTDEDELSLTHALNDYNRTGYEEDIWSCNGLSDLGDLSEELQKLGIKYGVDFHRAVLEIEERIANKEEMDRNIDYNGPLPSRARKQSSISEAEIISMFQTLNISD